MINWIRKPFQSRSFGEQLSLTVSLAILLFAFALTVTSSLILSRQMKDRLITESTSLVEQFAHDHLFTFLVREETSSKRLIEMLLAFPQIDHAVLYDPGGQQFAKGGSNSEVPSQFADITSRQAKLISEYGQHWRFAAPVIEQRQGSPVDDTPSSNTLLGYIEISVSKKAYTDSVHSIWLANSVLGLISGLAFLWWIAHRVQRLTRPLQSLSTVMSTTNGANSLCHAQIDGPPEIREIASVYNSLIDTIAKHQGSLEQQISIRTDELKSARDAALTAMRHKSEFTAALTHEMRSPVQSISGYVQLALQRLETGLDDDAAQEIRESLGVVLKKSNDLLAVINQVLNLAAAEAGKLDVRISSVDIEDLVKDTIQSVRPLADAQKNTINISHQGDTIVPTDKEKLYQVILNLLTNAVKFTQEGTIFIQSTVDEGETKISVSDTGVGIPPQKLELIFEPYRQLDMDETRPYAGTGLGLAVASEFCILLGGSISVTSEVGRGSTFTITLPIQNDHPAE